MPSFTNNVGGADGKATWQAAIGALSNAHQSLISNINSTPSFLGVSNGVYPSDAVPGSFTAEATDGGINFGVVDGSRTVPQIFNFSQTITNFLGTIDHPGDPVVADFPADGNYGWFRNDTSGAYGIVLNDAGSIVYPNFVYISGTISLTQHGDLHGLGGTSHDFQQIFGTITDLQHGTRSGGTLHAAATGLANGFMTTTQVGQLTTATTNIATLQTTVTDITSTGTPSNILNCTHLDVNGTKVVGARQTGWNNITATILRDGSGMTFTGVNADFTAGNFAIAVRLLFTLINDMANHGVIGP